MFRSILIAISAAFLSLADANASSDSAKGRDEFQQSYRDQQKSSPSLFSSSPVYHIIPAEDTITFAAEYRYFDVTVARPGEDISSKRDNLDERLDITGWSASPYIAFQAKHFGFGFTGETGRRDVRYYRRATDAVAYEEHVGLSQYSGLGLNLFWTPGWDIFPKFAVPTVIVGGKSLNVIEKSSGKLREPFSPVDMQKFQYSVLNYQAGGNVSLRFVRHFTVIPWVDFSAYKAGKPKSSTGTAVGDPSVSDDAELIWNSAPPMTYGIDFAVKILGLNVHLGGVIGILGTINKGSDRIQDNSRSVSISFDTRGG